MQGGAVAAAFSSMFPHLVNDGVVFIAAAGMMDVGHSFLFCTSLGEPNCNDSYRNPSGHVVQMKL